LGGYRGHERRWCGMAACGNRAKAVAYRARGADAAVTASTRPSRSRATRELVLESCDVEPHLPGVSDQRRRVQLLLMPEQQVVHLPEPPLRRRGLRGLRGLLRVVVPERDGEVSEDETQAVAQGGQQAADDGRCSRTMRALEVAVFQQGDPRARGPERVIPRGDGDGEELGRQPGRHGWCGRCRRTACVASSRRPR